MGTVAVKGAVARIITSRFAVCGVLILSKLTIAPHPEAKLVPDAATSTAQDDAGAAAPKIRVLRAKRVLLVGA